MKAVSSKMEFTSIVAGPLVKVFVEERTEGNIIIRAPKDIMEQLEIKVEGNELNIGYRKGTDINIDFKKRKSMPTAEIYIPNNGRLSKFEAAACSTIDVKPAIKAKELEISCVGVASINLSGVADKADITAKGASNIKLDIECTKLECDIAGAAEATISGSATKAEFDILGASTLRASALKTSQVEAEIAGASTAHLTTDIADVEASGASNININCSTQLKASAAGASTIRYSGDCQVNITKSTGASTIRKK